MLIQRIPNGLSLLIVALLIVPPLVYFVANPIRHQLKLSKGMSYAEVQNFSFWMNELRSKQDDPALVRFVKDELLIPPNIQSSNPTDDPSVFPGKQMKILEPYLKKIVNGFVVDVGARRGKKQGSWLVQALGWTGLRLEPDPRPFSTPDFESRNRHFWLVNTGLSPNSYPELLKNGRNSTQAQFLPLYTLLLALGKTDVGYLRLSTNGSELDILKTVPFDKVQIKILSVAYFPPLVGSGPLKVFMKNKGYEIIKDRARKVIFVQRDLLKRKRASSRPRLPKF